MPQLLIRVPNIEDDVMACRPVCTNKLATAHKASFFFGLCGRTNGLRHALLLLRYSLTNSEILLEEKSGLLLLLLPFVC